MRGAGWSVADEEVQQSLRIAAPAKGYGYGAQAKGDTGGVSQELVSTRYGMNGHTTTQSENKNKKEKRGAREGT